MTIYVAIHRGIHSRRIIGIYTVLEQAVQEGIKEIENEKDHYHDTEIVEMEIDTKGDKLLGTFKWDRKLSKVVRHD